MDFSKLNWTLLESISRARPDSVAVLRENVRRNMIDAAKKSDNPGLAVFADGLSNEALDSLVHFGFSEQQFWQTLCEA